MEILNRHHAPSNFHIPREFGNLGELHIWKFRIKVPEFTITTAQNLNCEPRSTVCNASFAADDPLRLTLPRTAGSAPVRACGSWNEAMIFLTPSPNGFF